MSDTTTSPQTSNPRTRRGLWWFAALLLLVLVFVTCWQFYFAPSGPVLPGIDTKGFDPEIVQAIEADAGRVKKAPKSAKAWGHLGMRLMAHDFRKEAAYCFAQAEQLDPKDVRWVYYQGLALSLGDPDAALPKMRRATELAGDEPDVVRLSFAELLLGQGQFEEAEQQFRHILSREPKNARAQLGLGRTLYMKGQPKESLSFLQAAAASTEKRQSASMQLAEVQLRLGQAEQGRNLMQNAAMMQADLTWPDPLLAEVQLLQVGERARLLQARRLLNDNRFAEAARLLEVLTQDYPLSENAFFNLGRALMSLHRPAEAEQAFLKSTTLSPGLAEAHNFLGLVQAQLGKTDAALSSFQKAIELQPGFAQAYFNLAQLYRGQKDVDKAITILQQSVQAQPNFLQAYWELSNLLRYRSRPDEALQYVHDALLLAPGEPLFVQSYLELIARRRFYVWSWPW